MLKERGASTLGGQNIWFDEDVRRLNADGRGRLLGEFKGDDRLIVWTSKNQYYITGYDLQQHFPDETILVNRYDPGRVYSLCYYDRSQKYYYLKRFTAEATEKMQEFLEEDCDFVCITGSAGAQLEITYGGAHAGRPADRVEIDTFVGVKSHRAKGKRLTTYEVSAVRVIEPELPPEPETPETPETPDDSETAATPDTCDTSAASNASKVSGTVEEAAQSEMPDASDASDASGTAGTSGTSGTAKTSKTAKISGTTGSTGTPSASEGAATHTVTESGGVAFEVERPKGDTEQVVDPEQLNLF